MIQDIVPRVPIMHNQLGLNGYTCLELCAGAGGQALGFEAAGFNHVALVELDADACATLTENRKHWRVLQEDVREFCRSFDDRVDIITAGVPCPPFSVAGKRLGADDERDLFPSVANLALRIRPRAIVFENVRGLLSKRFDSYRSDLAKSLSGYTIRWTILNAADFGVPQNRLRAIGVGLNDKDLPFFHWPLGRTTDKTVGSELKDLMSALGWRRATEWAQKANGIAPTLVGGSHRHGGADLGPTRTREVWRRLGVDGLGLANAAPDADFIGMPKLTNRMAATLQGFPKEWHISGRKTSVYRQIGNALPPPLARAVAGSLYETFIASDRANARIAS